MHRMLKKRGVTLMELIIAMAVSTILILGMGMVLVVMFRGMGESQDFATLTGRVDLIRQLTFDARTGDALVYPSTDYTVAYSATATGNGSGYYSSGGFVGHRVQFNAVRYNPITMADIPEAITWESRRPTSSTDPYTVYRWVNTETNPRFGQEGVVQFEVIRQNARSFTVQMQSVEGTEQVTVQLAVTLRNVLQ